MTKPDDRDRDAVEQSDELELEDLPADVHDTLLHYKSDDETVAEALNRVVAGIVPHASTMPDHVDPEGDLSDQEFVIVHGRTIDDYVEEIVYDNAADFVSTLNAVPENPEEIDL